MVAVTVGDYNQTRAISSDSLDAVLSERASNGMNSWWIWVEDANFPCLAILANANLACVHYFPEDGHAGFQAQGPAAGLDGDEETIFSISGPFEKIPMPNTSVIEFAKAEEVAKEFVLSRTMSAAVNWTELGGRNVSFRRV